MLRRLSLLHVTSQVPLKADWRSLLDLAGVAAHAMFTPVAFVENATSNTQARRWPARLPPWACQDAGPPARVAC